MVKKSDTVVYAVGSEVEHSPVFSMKTLFVNGIRNVSQMVEFAKEHGCKHICLGAYNSFQKSKKWNDVIRELLETGIYVSFHYHADAHEFLLETLDTVVWGHPYFIPVIVVNLPHVLDLSKNLMLKINDEDRGSNLGVWSSPMREVLDSNRFASWADFENRETVLTASELKKLKDK